MPRRLKDPKWMAHAKQARAAAYAATTAAHEGKCAAARVFLAHAQEHVGQAKCRGISGEAAKELAVIVHDEGEVVAGACAVNRRFAGVRKRKGRR
jgi:hypothetical protein